MLLHEQAAALTPEQAEALAKVSNTIKTAGAHLATIKAVYNTTGEKNGNTWSSVTVDFENEAGETVQISEFFGKAKDESQAAIDKAQKSTTRLLGIMTKLAKAAGIPDLKTATGGHQESTDAKGRSVVTYPKFTNKKVYIVTTTEVSGDDKDATKCYVKQIVDTSKFLDKDGKDGMKRDCVESYDAAAKAAQPAIAYGFEANPTCIAEVAKLQAKAAGIAPQAQTQQPLAGMPAVETQSPAANQDI